MRKWFYIPVIVLIVLVGLALLIPYGIGFVVQKKFSETLGVLSQSGSLQFNLVNYHRGWFSSNATIRVKTTHPALLNQWLGSQTGAPVEFLVTENIGHGPILKVITPARTVRWIVGQALITIHVNPAIGNIDSITLINLDGSMLSAITAPNIHIRNPAANSEAKITGFAATAELSRDMRAVTLRLNTPNLQLSTNDFQQQVVGFVAEYDLKRSPSGLYLGSKNTQIADASWQTPDKQFNVQFQGLSIQSKSEEIESKINYEVNAIVPSIIVDGVKYGQQQFNLEMNSIDVPSLLALSKELKNTQQAQSVGLEQLMRYNRLTIMLLSKGLEIELKKLNLDTAWGKPSATAHLVLRPLTTPVNSLLDLFNNLVAKVNLNLPAAFLAQALTTFNHASSMNSPSLSDILHLITTPNTDPNLNKLVQQKLAFWVENKWLIPQGDSYQMNFVFENSHPYINGQPFVNKPMVLPLAPASPAPASGIIMGIPATEVTPGEIPAVPVENKPKTVINTKTTTHTIPGISAPVSKPKVILQPQK